MTTRTAEAGPDPLIETRADLTAVFARGEKPKAQWRIGTEHEKFVYATSDHHAPSYDEKGGIHALLTGLTKFGWTPVHEGENVIALSGPVVAVFFIIDSMLQHFAKEERAKRRGFTVLLRDETPPIRKGK